MKLANRTFAIIALVLALVTASQISGMSYIYNSYNAIAHYMNDHKWIDQEEVLDAQDNKIGTIKTRSIIHPIVSTVASLYVSTFFDNEGKKIGHCRYCTFRFKKSGYIFKLHINQNERGKGYGAQLLAHVGKKLFQQGCTLINGKPKAFDLKSGENHSEMQKKLIAFYGQFGAKKDGRKMAIEAPSAKQHNQEQALQRAAMIANHIAQSSQAYSVAPSQAIGRINILLNHITK